MKIDAHQHFWLYAPETHDWITTDMALLRRNYLPEDLAPELKKADYAGCVAIQAAQTEAETEFLLQLAAGNPFIKGVVGWVDLRAENAVERLNYFARHPLFKGVRHIVQSEPDVNFLLQPAFLKGISFLQPLRLTYDILIYPQHLPVAAQFVCLFPEQKFVLDHLAKPSIEKGERQPWARELKELARQEQVYCKLSGLVTEADTKYWKTSDILPYLDIALEAFGPDRLLIGSDWPVCRLAGEYSAIMRLVEDFITCLSSAEQANILGNNAIRFYNL